MKKIIKKISYVLIFIAVLVSLTGCFDKISDNVSKKLNAKNDKAISLGSWQDNIYTNDFLNIKYEMPNAWTRYTDEQIAEVMDIGSELLNDDQKYMAKISELTTVTYMMSSNPNTNSNVILMSEKDILNNVTVSSYMEKLRSGLAENESLNYEFLDNKSEIVNSVSYETLEAKVQAGSVNMYQKYYVRKQGKYFVAIIVTSTVSEDELSEIVNQFTKLN